MEADRPQEARSPTPWVGEESYEAEGVIKTGFTFLLVLLRAPWEKWGWNGVRALTSPRLSKAFTQTQRR